MLMPNVTKVRQEEPSPFQLVTHQTLHLCTSCLLIYVIALVFKLCTNVPTIFRLSAYIVISLSFAFLN